ncbi:hypothetical protein HII31_11843 [Pseudocercospora fuligena]|uniref:Uncharacterized protein n=1 Tax=Pseudocercospora fuligena TaxID=685502 RepID=A0A8H6VC62_9PEZI|nr:hypothetical protein HII31_11843 [Pseudocercospora fuligena]
MVPPPTNTYYCIPPPPLREFYDSSTRRPPPLLPSETTVASRPPPMAANDAGDGWRYVDIKKTTRTPASSPSAARDCDVPPLAVYHICRVCLRPRSERYHRDHPIPANGVPPPPGICRRCRIAPAEDLKAIAEVTERRESNTIRVGVGCLVPDEDAFTNSEMREKRARRAMGDATYVELEPARERSSTTYPSTCSTERAPSPAPREREEIIYRHIHEMIPPPPLRLPVRAAPASTAQGFFDAAEASRVQQQAIVDAASHNATAGSSPWTRSIRIPPPPPANARQDLLRSEIFDYSRLEPEREIEVVIERGRKQDKPIVRRAPSPDSTSSSSDPTASSEKTRWPAAAYEPTARPRQGQAKSDPERVKMVVEQKEQVSAEIRTNLPMDEPNQEPDRYDRSERRKRVVSRVEPDSASNQVEELQDTYSRQQRAESLPYPENELSLAATMPSPTSHVSRSIRTSKRETSGKADGEYEYVVRKVQSSTRSPTRGRYDERETTERYVHRTRPEEEDPLPEATSYIQRGRHLSDASSRVHFSKKVEISPTPPNSNASSREFRDFAWKRGVTRERREDLIAEYERTGRSRNQDTSPEDDRDRTPRPGRRQRKREYDASESGSTSSTTSDETPDVDDQRWKPPHDLTRRSRIDDDLFVWDGSTNSEDSEEYVQKADYRQWRAK